MKKLHAPKWDSAAVYRACAEDFTVATERRNRLVSVRSNIAIRCEEYDRLAGSWTLFRATLGPPAPATKDDLVALYEQKFVPASRPGRPCYEQVLATIICPTCGYGRVRKVDHFLPKAHYPALVVHPSNLVPICSDCNEEKLEYYPTSFETQLLHPYFDDINGIRWLWATVVETKPPVVNFSVDRVNEPWLARLRNNFGTYKLQKAFRVAVAGELADNQAFLKALHKTAGSAGIRAHLQERRDSAAERDPNGWRAVAFEALAESDWFCEVGFHHIE